MLAVFLKLQNLSNRRYSWGLDGLSRPHIDRDGTGVIILCGLFPGIAEQLIQCLEIQDGKLPALRGSIKG